MAEKALLSVNLNHIPEALLNLLETLGCTLSNLGRKFCHILSFGVHENSKEFFFFFFFNHSVFPPKRSWSQISGCKLHSIVVFWL